MTVLQNSLYASALVLVIALIRAARLHRLPKNTFCVLWAAAALRLLLPFSIKSELSFFTFSRSLFKEEPGGLTPFTALVPLEEAQAEIGSAASKPFPVLTALWLAGVCVLAAFFLISYVRAVARFRLSKPVSSVSIGSLPVKPPFPVQVRQSSRISGPLTYGLFRPIILLPETAGWDDAESLSFILAHECAHIRRFDCLTKLLFLAALCVHWFNPAVWLLCRLANRDMELACDEMAIRSLGESNRFAYARTLLSQAEHASGFSPLFNRFGARAVDERIAAALKRRKRSVWRTTAACLLVAATLTVFATSASAGAGPATDFLAGGPVFGDGLDSGLCFGFGVDYDGGSRNSAMTYMETVTYTEGNQSVFGLNTSDSERLAEAYRSIPFTTLDGEPYHLKSGQGFFFELRDLWIEQGYLWGFLMERKEGEPYSGYVTENGRKVLLKADFQLLSLEPLSFLVGGERFDSQYHVTVLEENEG